MHAPGDSQRTKGSSDATGGLYDPDKLVQIEALRSDNALPIVQW